MSRFSQMFQNKNTREIKKAAGIQQLLVPENGLIDSKVPSPDISIEDSNVFSNLNSKLKDYLQDFRNEEQKLCTNVESIDIKALLEKVPLLPRLAHQLPQPLKTRIKEALDKIANTKDRDIITGAAEAIGKDEASLSDPPVVATSPEDVGESKPEPESKPIKGKCTDSGLSVIADAVSRVISRKQEASEPEESSGTISGVSAQDPGVIDGPATGH